MMGVRGQQTFNAAARGRKQPMRLTDEIIYDLKARTLAPMMERLAERTRADDVKAICLCVRDACRERWPKGDARWEALQNEAWGCYYAAFADVADAAAAAAAAARVADGGGDAEAADECLAQARDLIAACEANGITLRNPMLDTSIVRAIDAKEIKLDMQSVHGNDDNVCGTTHCRAGSAIYLNEVARELEPHFGWVWVASAIYVASHPGKPIPDFHCDEDEALADMRARAAMEPMGATS